MPDYKLGKIYKIVSDQTDKIYVGSTAQKHLSSRLAVHKSSYKAWTAGKSNFVTSFDIVKFDDARIVLIEVFPCDIKEELQARERQYIHELKDNVVNKYIPTRTKKEYYDQNKEISLQKDKVRYGIKKEEILTKAKARYELQKEEMLKKVKARYATNKEQILEQKREKVLCDCGKEVRKDGLSEHKKTITHQDKMANV